MNRVLITGVDGFTGRYLAAAMQKAGFEVHGVVRAMPVQAVAGVSNLHVADMADGARLAEVVQTVMPHKVAHLAAIAFVGHGNADALYHVNLLGTRNLLEVLVHSSVPLEAVLLASSANVYGNNIAGTLDELTPPAPANDYAVSKLAMEYMTRLYAERLPLVISRPFNYTGVGQDESFLIPKIVSHARRRAPAIELGNLHVARDFSDVRTVVQYYHKLLTTPSALGQTFNVCAGRGHTLHEVLELVQRLANHRFEVRVNPAFVRANEVKLLVGNGEKLHSTVGKVPTIELKDTLRWMLEQ